MKDIMLDLETLGNRPGCVLVALGAVRFDANGLGKEFYMRIDPQSCMEAGLEMDVSTVLWWLAQSDAARAEICKPGTALRAVLGLFSNFVGSRETRIWGNGASFDNAILAEAYRRDGSVLPWDFWNDRCYRTVKASAPLVKLARVGTYHNALDDAKSQALHLIEIWKAGS